MASTNEPWSAARMLEAWGLRTCGGFLKNPLAQSTGGAGACDENWQAKTYVEGVKDFALVRPVLVWVCTEGRDPASFPVKLPGESLDQALRRLGWLDYLMIAPSRIALEVYRDFEVELIEALQVRPFVPMHVAEKEDKEQPAPAPQASLRDMVA